ETANQLQLKLSMLEKIFALHGDIWIDKSLLTKKAMAENPWHRSVIKGFRAPGAAIPFVVLLGTMRYRGGKDFTAIYKKKPVEVFEFSNAPFKRWIVTK
ncbi:MAG: hypothetical protein ACOVLB_05780, partial [Candidatus Nanopelagicus sp.]